jgi:hypothetical protein
LDKINLQSITSPEPCIACRVDLPDSDYSLVPEAEEGEAEAALQYVEVLDDIEGAQANLADEGKPRCILPSVSKFNIQLSMDACAFKFRSCMEP